MTMYPKLGQVKVGDWLRYESSGDPDHHYVEITRLTAKLIYVTGFDDPQPGFSREHGALFDVGCYDAYAGRLRQMTDADHAELKSRQSAGR